MNEKNIISLNISFMFNGDNKFVFSCVKERSERYRTSEEIAKNDLIRSGSNVDQICRCDVKPDYL